jgi:hypothetical protein
VARQWSDDDLDALLPSAVAAVPCKLHTPLMRGRDVVETSFSPLCNHHHHHAPAKPIFDAFVTTPLFHSILSNPHCSRPVPRS